MLNGVRILDLSHLLPGQFATSLLAQLGADVTMVERPPDGHAARTVPTSFAMCNHSKESVVLDLKADAGREAFLDLACDVDVVVEQFRPGVVSRLGVGPEDVAVVNPDAVYCSISGFGQEGLRAEEVGHDLNYVGLSGILDQTGHRDEAPTIPGTQLADFGAALFAALSIVAALNGDSGEYVDLSMVDATVAFASNALAEFFGRGYMPARGEGRLTGGYPCYCVYECADGEYVTVGAIEPHFWETLCDELGLEEFADDQWADEPRRSEVFGRLREAFRERPQADWLERFDPSEVPVAPVNAVEDVPDDEHVRERNLLVEVPYEDTEKTARTVRYPARFKSHSLSVSGAPTLGADTASRLADAGYADEQIAELADEDVIVTTTSDQ